MFFYSYEPLTFATLLFLLVVFFMAKTKSKKEFKEKIIDKELADFAKNIDIFFKENKPTKTLLSRQTIQFAIKNNLFTVSIKKQFYQILQKYPNEKEFIIEFNHNLLS
ncbi:hypothetical protein [Campylobacter insulaenigrae]|uniref:Uncharacterized protein n=1 Tax=Campylobacter insulaenigrae NCTC 12927 TaxID=1031564 RepID=A0A0A8H1F1_9BACT|nr:hypothetical protein [Campylobacter insulaenigrae]AJC87802.1 hypothetical protein CINS_0838 [Campylobacter insulaenigrae NCTC 12927]MCR6572970.1 hypothetical protein [Campylobacter insulaenigrae]MCR6577436.1 hypothetical protein [Campylobacter insulaenigrae]MCR6581601.1 hypothetical protein [Campylobacter insulaenigrae]MCR6586865.1 hypothetical protein [Campylobacter insulaenigrae]